LYREAFEDAPQSAPVEAGKDQIKKGTVIDAIARPISAILPTQVISTIFGDSSTKDQSISTSTVTEKVGPDGPPLQDKLEEKSQDSKNTSSKTQSNHFPLCRKLRNDVYSRPRIAEAKRFKDLTGTEAGSWKFIRAQLGLHEDKDLEGNNTPKKREEDPTGTDMGITEPIVGVMAVPSQ
jgi:hypothetical protein